MSKMHNRPIRCAECRQGTLHDGIAEFASKALYEGKPYDIVIKSLPVMVCDSCGEHVHTNESHAHIDAALRDMLGLLSPAAIKSGRQRFGLTQKDIARCLGFAPETLSRWETGSVLQSRAHDKLLRLFFDVPEVRSALASHSVGAGTMAQKAVFHEMFGFESKQTWSGIANLPRQDTPPDKHPGFGIAA